MTKLGTATVSPTLMISIEKIAHALSRLRAWTNRNCGRQAIDNMENSTMSIRKLTSENAVIKTAAVEVKTLTISGKQVTLAVFRQLPEESPIDPTTEWPDFRFKGLIWGRVNYHPDKCGDIALEHVHVVWQRGETLNRGRIYAPNVVAGKLERHPLDKNKWATVNRRRDGKFYRTVDCPVFWTNQEWHALLDARRDPEDSDKGARDRDQFTQWRLAYNRLYNDIETLDQLYIAV